MRRTGTLADIAVGAGLMAATANVIMQLSRPGVGYGVVESQVHSGNLFRHPVKRTRTTLTYLAVVTLGSADDRLAYRRAVNRSHAQVRSTPSSPVAYNAFDPELQLWVAACLYRGFLDTHQLFGQPLDATTAQQVHRAAAAFGTVLQVPADRWPDDLAGFEHYWKRALDEIHIDDTVRHYLTRLIDLEPFPVPVRRLGRRLNRFITTGFLPEEFRSQMHLDWTPRDQQRFDRMAAAVGALTRAIPGPLRRFPFNALLWDLRLRRRTGRPLV